MKNKTLYILGVIAVFIVTSASLIYAEYKRTTTTTTTTVTNDDEFDEAAAASVDEERFIEFDINTKREYKSPQRLEGQIVLYNNYTEPLPADFNIDLYKDDKLVKELRTTVQDLEPGQTNYTFRAFGIPSIDPNDTADHGNWTIVMYRPEEGRANSKEAHFRILPSF